MRRPLQLLAAAAVLVAIAAVLGAGDGPRPGFASTAGLQGGPPVDRTGAMGRVALDGDWVVAMDPSGTGGRRGWSRGRFPGRTVTVPYSPNAGTVAGTPGIRSHQGSVAWYRTTFDVPRDGRYALRFESVNHDATIWIDGRFAARHRGEYLPFEVRPHLAAGRHQLVVRADWRDPLRMKRTGWHRTWFNFGGINRQVTLRALDDSEVVAPTVRTRLRRDGEGRLVAVVDLTAQVRNLTSERREITAVAALERAGRRFAVDFPTVGVAPNGSRTVAARLRIPDPALWSTADPALWSLTIGVPEESGWQGRIGLREISRRGARMFLNGAPLRLYGASIHEDARGRGDALLPADMDEIVAGLRAIGANATRAQHPLSPALLERLDAAGILLWQGIGPVDAPGAWTSRGPRLARQARERVRVTLRTDQTHPSIMAWNLANEVAGDGHPAGQVPFIEGAARELHRRDPGRLVALDIWGAHPPRRPSRMYRQIDAIGWTNYIGWYESTYATSPEVAGLIRERLAALRRVFPAKVIAVTEFGAEGNGQNHPDEPGGYRFQARLLRTHLRTYRSIPGVAGMLVWNLRDFAVAPSFAGGSIRRQVPDIRLVRGVNQKGLLTYGGRPKLAAAAVRRELDVVAGRR